MRSPHPEPATQELDSLRSGGEQTLPPLSRLRRLAALERDDLATVCVYGVVTGLVSLAVPIAAQSLVNTVAFTALLQPLVVLAILVLCGLLLAGFSRTAQQQVIETLHQRFFVRATRDVAARLLRADVRRLPGRRAAELTNRFFDVVIVQKAAATLLVDGLSAVLQGSVALLLLAFYHPALLAFDVLLVGAIIFVLFGLGSGGIETAIKESKLKHQTGAWLEQLAADLRGSKSAAASEFAFAKADSLAHGYVLARSKHFRVLLRQIIGSYLLQAVATAALLGLGGLLVIEEQLTLGQLVAAELAVAGALAGMAKAGKQLESFYDLVAAVDKVGTLVDLPSERREGEALAFAASPARVEVIDAACPADFGSPLQAASFSLAPGERLCVLGEASDGRSALADLLFAVQGPSRGRVAIDGTDVRTLNLGELRRSVSLVARGHVYEGTLADNLLLGRTPHEAASAERVLEVVGLSESIHALPEGLTTALADAPQLLGDDPALRLTLARALLHPPRLLLLDGALDPLGVHLTERVLQWLDAAESPPTVVVFTHREDVAAAVGNVRRLSGGVLSPLAVAERTSSNDGAREVAQ